MSEQRKARPNEDAELIARVRAAARQQQFLDVVSAEEARARFEAHLDPTGIALVLERTGAEDVRKSIHMHINFGLFADILRDLASTVGRIPKDDVTHRDTLTQAVAELHRALGRV